MEQRHDSRLIRVRVDDGLGPYEMCAVAGDHITAVLQRKGRPYEWRLLKTVEPLLREGMVVVDAGANTGNHSLFFARRGCGVVAFEPNPAALAALRANAALPSLSGRIDVRPLALGAARGSGSVSDPGASGLGSVAVRRDEGGAVAIEALDDVLDVGPVGLMKIDVEGAELDVLLGARRVIERDRPDIVVEMLQGPLADIRSFLRSAGYHRLPLSLAPAPTYLFSTRRLRLARVLATGRPLEEAAARWRLAARSRRRRRPGDADA